jgi:hypothetical protein
MHRIRPAVYTETSPPLGLYARMLSPCALVRSETAAHRAERHRRGEAVCGASLSEKIL